MIAIPAVDVRGGACVQLVGGSYDEERVRLDDPVGVTRGWGALGYRRLHAVDLDAATGRGSNADTLRAVVGEPALDVQVGGGIRDGASVERWLAAGACRVVVGTRALEEPAWLAEVAASFPGRVVVAADVRDGCVVTHGWARTTARAVLDVVRELNDQPLAAVLVTAVHREGRLGGTDLPLMAGVAACSRHPVHASGGIASLDDLRALAACGVAGAVVGMALYTGALDPRAVAEEFGG